MMKICFVVFMIVCGRAPILHAQDACADSVFPPALKEHIGRVLGDRHGRVLIFLLRFSDFGCELCLNDFLDFCDSLRAAGKGVEERKVAMFFSRDRNSISYQSTTLRKWAKANTIGFPMYIARLEETNARVFDHSGVYLLGVNWRIELCGSIPLSVELKRLMVERLYSMERK